MHRSCEMSAPIISESVHRSTEICRYDKGFVINEEQAAVIRKIFTLFLLGYSSEKIGKLLDGEGIKTICNAPQWSGVTE